MLYSMSLDHRPLRGAGDAASITAKWPIPIKEREGYRRVLEVLDVRKPRPLPLFGITDSRRRQVLLGGPNGQSGP